MTTPAIPIMTTERAGELVATVRQAVERSREAIVELWRGRAWVALGFDSWDDLCDAEFGVRLRLPVEERQALVADLRAEGMSTRAVASALGVHHKTVGNDMRSGGEYSPPDGAVITGNDGKSYPRPAARPRPSPTPESEPPVQQVKPEPEPAGPTLDELAAKAVASYPELAFYVEIGDLRRAAATAAALDGYDEDERTMRRDMLFRAIAAERRARDMPPSPELDRLRNEVGRRARAGKIQKSAATIAQELAIDPDCITSLVDDTPEHLADMIVDPLFRANDLLGVAVKKLRRAHLRSVGR